MKKRPAPTPARRKLATKRAEKLSICKSMDADVSRMIRQAKAINKILDDKPPFTPASLRAIGSEWVPKGPPHPDTARIDFLEKHGALLNTASMPPGPHVCIAKQCDPMSIYGDAGHYHAPTYRAAIDAAMRATK